MDDSDKPKVLILEDEPIIARVVSRFLMTEGFLVDIATNGLDAKEKINGDARYDIMVFDIRTPVISGIQLYEYLEKERPGLTDSVIFATGDTMNETTKNFLERTKCPWICKPYTPAQLKNTIRQHLEWKQTQQSQVSPDIRATRQVN